jgi:PAS domain S-box-containing protein
MHTRLSSIPVRYGIALASVAAAFLIRWALTPVLGDTVPYIQCFPAVMVSAWYGGLGPGLAATALGALIAVFFLVPPHFSLVINQAADAAGLILFLLVGTVISTLNEGLRRSRETAERQAADLQTSLAERERAHRSLRESEERLRFALEAAHLGYWDWNIGTGHVKWSENLEPLHGMAPGSFTGTFEAFLERVHPEDRERIETAITRALEQGEGYDTELRIVWPNGGIHWVVAQGKIIRDEAGKPARMIGVTRDITERKQAEEVRSYLAAIVESSEDAIIGKTLDGVLTSWNAGAERLYGYSADEVIGRPVSLLIPPDVPNDVPSILERLRRGERIRDYETVRQARDGRRLQVSLTVSPIRDPTGRITGAATIARDITARKLLETELQARHEQIQTQAEELEAQYEELQVQHDELADQDRRRNEFLALLAHELRNPLAPIVIAAEVLRQADPSDPAFRRQREILVRQTRHLARLVDDLLDVSRVTQGKITLQKEPVDLAAVVEQAVQISNSLIHERGHDLSVTLPPGVVRLEADPTRLVQVLCNLLNNAAMYTDLGGKIWLSAEVEGSWLRVEGEWLRVEGEGPNPQPSTLNPQPDPTLNSQPSTVTIRVRDTGRGIAPDVLPHIFDMFVQVDRTTTLSQGGLGVGLTLVRSLVEQHGGTVEAHSTGPGPGSEFIIRLPIADWGLRIADWGFPSPNPQSAIPNPQSRRVLVVDDNIDAAETLADLLKLWGHEVCVAHDGAGGLKAAREYRPEVILLDIGMPDMDGYEVARRLRAEEAGRQAQLLAVTGYGQAEDRQRAREAGFDHHLTKPVDPEVVRDLLAGEA